MPEVREACGPPKNPESSEGSPGPAPRIQLEDSPTQHFLLLGFYIVPNLDLFLRQRRFPHRICNSSPLYHTDIWQLLLVPGATPQRLSHLTSRQNPSSDEDSGNGRAQGWRW